MADRKNTDFGQTVNDTREYVNLRIDEAKLKATKGLSMAMSRTLSYLLIIAVLAITLGLISYALLQWLNSLVGAPWGTLIVWGVFMVALIVLWILRGRMFRNMFVKLFIDVFFGDDEDEQ